MAKRKRNNKPEDAQASTEGKTAPEKKKTGNLPLKEVPHEGKMFKVERVSVIGRATHHYFTDDKGKEQDFVEIRPKQFTNEI